MIIPEDCGVAFSKSIDQCRAAAAHAVVLVAIGEMCNDITRKGGEEKERNELVS